MIAGGASVAIDVARALASAEAAGICQECVDRATEYAKVREQFGRVIATFQAVKHHCANMLVASELATASTWDAARASENDPEQFRLAAAVAAAESIPAALTNSQLNIQVHGGIGFTWEHDGHMLLRRASALVAFVDADAAARDVVDMRLEGLQRELGIDLPPEAEELRTKTRKVAEEIAALPADQQLAKLVETGYVQPHWPKPWGLEAKALEQLVIDEEFKRAKINRPSYGITAWNILTIIQHGTPRADRALGEADAHERARVVPAVQRAGRRLGRRRREDEGREGRRRVHRQRPEGVDVRCAVLPHGSRDRPHRPRRAEARRRHHGGHRHAREGRRGASAARSVRTRDVQRGLLHATCSSPTTTSSVRSTAAGRSPARRSATSASASAAASASASRSTSSAI